MLSMANVGEVTAFSGRKQASRSHAVGEATNGSLSSGELTRLRPWRINSELRATVSIGLMRPPTSTGSFPNSTRAACAGGDFDGPKLAPTQRAPRTKAINGRNRYIRTRAGCGGQILPDDNQIG